MLIDVLRSELLAARKAKMKGEGSPYAVNLLTALVGEATRIGKDAQPPRETSDTEVLSFLRKTQKTLEDTRTLVEGRVASGTTTRDDELTQVDAELALVVGFLATHQPQQLDAGEIKALILALRTTTPETKLGDVMAHLKANYAGRYDGKLASQVAREALA